MCDEKQDTEDTVMGRKSEIDNLKKESLEKENSIAIIAMSGRFPRVGSIEALWENIIAGYELVQEFTDEELINAGVTQEELQNKHYVRRGAFLSDAELFDASFFGYSPQEALRIDPQQRVFLEVCHEALEKSGHGPGIFDGKIGVFAGGRPSTWQALISSLKEMKVSEHHAAMNGNLMGALSTRVSYHLNCTGPALTIQTFCSSSLVAIHLACQSLLEYECDMAIGGGSTIRFPQNVGYKYILGGTLSRTGRCYSFDARGDGLIHSDATVAVVMRRLEDALNDRDQILAIIRGTAINNDGNLRAGYIAPGVKGQSEVVTHAIDFAGIAPEDIGYIEAHGTGTLSGDAIEFRSLKHAFHTTKKSYCGIGSIKTNLGHADCAAGITGLVKAIMSLRCGILPPNFNFESPNPDIDFKNSPFFVVTEPKPWISSSCKRIAGVNSFGIGGTNAHVILEEAQVQKSESTSEHVHILPFSAKSKSALNKLKDNFFSFISDNPDTSLADMSYTLQRCRVTHPIRQVVIAKTLSEVSQLLKSNDPIVSNLLDETEQDKLELSRIWLEGKEVEWKKIYNGEQRNRIEIPTYPFNRGSFGQKEISDS